MHFPHVPREILMPETCYLKLCSGAGRCLSTSNFGHPEQGGAGDAKGGAVIVGSLDVCPTASRSGNTPTSQAAAATRERSADSAKRIINPTRTPTMGPSPRRFGRGHCTSAGGSPEGAFAERHGYARIDAKPQNPKRLRL
jgi:hypothetical protein